MTGTKAQAEERWGNSLLAFILTAAAAFRFSQLDGLPPFIDESADLVLSVDYKSWDVWSRLLHGKLLGYLWFKPIYLLAWDPLYAARLFSAVIGVICVALGYWLLLSVVGRKAALAGTALLASMPLAVFHDRLALFDGFVVAAMTASVLLYLRSREDQPLTLLAGGFVFGMAIFTKAYALLAILPWLPVLRRRTLVHSRALVIVGLGFLASILAMTLFLAPEFKEGAPNLEGALGAPHRFLAPDLSVGQRASLALEQIGQIFGYLYGYNGWAFLAVVLLTALIPGPNWKFRLELLGTWLLWCVILCVAFRFLFSRYLLLGLPALGLSVALTFDDCVEKVRTMRRRWKGASLPLTFLLLLAVCFAGFIYRDSLIAAQSLDRVLPPRDAYQYLWGTPSGFGLREIADQLGRLDLTDNGKVICVTRGMGTGTHGAATLPLLMRHTPIRFVHLWLQSDQDIQAVRDLPEISRVVIFVDDAEFLDERMLSRLGAKSKLLFEVKGTTGRPDYRLVELLR